MRGRELGDKRAQLGFCRSSRYRGLGASADLDLDAFVSETIPLGRIQAVRRIEPLLWRPFGWCRLEVDIAGAGTRNQRGEGSQMARKYLLPVGTHQDAWHLISRVLGGPAPSLSPPPSRARYKAPLSYHFLAAGHDDSHAVCAFVIPGSSAANCCCAEESCWIKAFNRVS